MSYLDTLDEYLLSHIYRYVRLMEMHDVEEHKKKSHEYLRYINDMPTNESLIIITTKNKTIYMHHPIDKISEIREIYVGYCLHSKIFYEFYKSNLVPQFSLNTSYLLSDFFYFLMQIECRISALERKIERENDIYEKLTIISHDIQYCNGTMSVKVSLPINGDNLHIQRLKKHIGILDRKLSKIKRKK